MKLSQIILIELVCIYFDLLNTVDQFQFVFKFSKFHNFLMVYEYLKAKYFLLCPSIFLLLFKNALTKMYSYKRKGFISSYSPITVEKAGKNF